MFRTALIAALLSTSAAFAVPPEFSDGGVVLGLQYGPGNWFLDGPKLTAQLGAGEASLLTNNTLSGHSATLRLGYNILGHATVEGSLTATGWNLFEPGRGGAGFGTGGVHWHPLQLAKELWKPTWLEGRAFDASVFFGLGYGILGQVRGLDGMVWQWGFDADWYFARTIGIGAFVRSTQLATTNYYVDFYDRAAPGNTLVLQDGGVGSFLQFGVSLTLRISP